MPMTVANLIASPAAAASVEWVPCPGPDQKGTVLTTWLVRQNAVTASLCACASGDREDMTVEPIPAVPGEHDAFAVIRSVLAGYDDDVEADIGTDIETGVSYRGSPLVVPDNTDLNPAAH
jgi:hypothetical protein